MDKTLTLKAAILLFLLLTTSPVQPGLRITDGAAKKNYLTIKEA